MVWSQRVTTSTYTWFRNVVLRRAGAVNILPPLPTLSTSSIARMHLRLYTNLNNENLPIYLQHLTYQLDNRLSELGDRESE